MRRSRNRLARRHRRMVVADIADNLFGQFHDEMIRRFEALLLEEGVNIDAMTEDEARDFISNAFEKVLPTESVVIARLLLPSNFRSLLHTDYGVNPDDSGTWEMDRKYLGLDEY